jgi:pimeloyl-ACP methyl ester carboxylesterase
MPRANGEGIAMPSAVIDGIETRYDIRGDGPPLLLFSPGGFDATMEKWSSLGIYAKTRPIDHLSRDYRCILFDRRECGQSGGRVERVTWSDYAAQGIGLLDHLGIERAHFMGGCMGVSPVAYAACHHPERMLSMVLYWPVGGAAYRMNANRRFGAHIAFARSEGMGAVVDLVLQDRKSFSGDPRGGPWASAILQSPEFAERYRALNIDAYGLIVLGMERGLFDRDTAPGAEPEDLMRCAVPALILPGADASHGRSAAHYLSECLPGSLLWDVYPDAQTEAATAEQIQSFLARHSA